MKLQADIQRRGVEGTLCRQALGDLEAIDAMDPMKKFGHGLGLVSLQAADEMPGELAAGELLELGQAFLQEILAEIFHSGARRRVNCCGALTLGNGQKRDGIHISTGGSASL